MLFFQCMSALFNPVNRPNRNIKWPLVVHTATMFSLVTMFTAMSLDILPIGYVNNREFPGTYQFPPGPNGYLVSRSSETILLIPTIFLFLNNWLADGLLVSPAPNSIYQVFEICRSFSSLVAISFTV